MSKMNTVRGFQVKPQIWYGIGSIKKLADFGCSKVCIVTDKDMVKFGLLDKITEVLDEAGVTYHVFDDVKPNPTTDIVEKGVAHMLTERPQALIALGGGSSIDTAKGIIYYTNNFKQIFLDPQFVINPHFIAIPTTAGTGSEVTDYAVLTDVETGTKIPLTESMMMPDTAILEPRLIESVPAGATAATGMDVLTHAIEAYVSTGNNPFSRCYASKATELVFKSLKACYDDGHDLESKASMQIASTMAGIAFNSAGLGMAHAIAHTVGAQYHMPHGMACAIALPYVISYNGIDDRAEHLYERLLHAIGVHKDEGRTAAATLVRMVVTLMKSMKLPLCLDESRSDTSDYDQVRPTLIKKAMADATLKTNPVQPSAEDMGTMLDMVCHGVF
ncbi:1-propanol dehydrogenase PduQ [Pseudoramibacter sp.]|jgi:1-propanol dehydrogenase|uniref:1-propanol dehydrogenase PduQ n=1 Tax=Pseudoramibacter sp. TaxID=2034862 RepID=UPI0025EDB9FD|nr:1-propanol dehydrogenase PduQ [Pseudoramibacter sp.]MCH4072474.1 iron-containing alcohol dehydrogenase [Pseudoramibacter sp.]MCH4106245.1 iron-containing alcohol dehydrogenase [Pseudoramibacter sp.]